MFKKILAVAVFLTGLASLSVTANQFKTPGAMYHVPLHQHLVDQGVSFVHRQFDKHIIVLPSAAEPRFVKGYDNPAAICAAVQRFQPIKKVSVYGTKEGVQTASCQ